MTLERWLSAFVLAFCLAYGYTAFWVMDATLPPFARFSPVWPSSFPKVLAVLGAILAFMQLFHKAQPLAELKRSELPHYAWRQAGLTILAMVAYALLLSTLGFVVATTGFLVATAAILGERTWHHLIPIALIAAGGIWYLVDPVLGIYMRPWPSFIGG
ncbi:MAG: tripartite tricarboxylate transporter TctB family protein [Gammaproteobacteria bacterium]|nr:MAG: tripartite tricarboxylate transporter TctB family protein [Gammaproteobacteria bacterium]